VADAGFAFDTELGAHEVATGAFEIDAQALRWAEFLPCVEAGACAAPAHLRRAGRGPGGRWERWRHGRWDVLDLREAACHLGLAQAQAWCAWAGRRLPTEAEWERAACTHPGAFRWGNVWEWTASPFAPYPGFVPHPYRDYSAPWFDGRPVLRGASYLTQPRMRHPRYRNFFPGHRSDVPAGLRSCAG
jgi:EgtB-related family protein